MNAIRMQIGSILKALDVELPENSPYTEDMVIDFHEDEDMSNIFKLPDDDEIFGKCELVCAVVTAQRVDSFEMANSPGDVGYMHIYGMVNGRKVFIGDASAEQLNSIDFLKLVGCSIAEIVGVLGCEYPETEQELMRPDLPVTEVSAPVEDAPEIPVIKTVVFRDNASSHQVDVVGELTDGSTVTVFAFYADELSFDEEELIGLTTEEASALFTKKDITYIQS